MNWKNYCNCKRYFLKCVLSLTSLFSIGTIVLLSGCSRKPSITTTANRDTLQTGDTNPITFNIESKNLKNPIFSINCSNDDELSGGSNAWEQYLSFSNNQPNKTTDLKWKGQSPSIPNNFKLFVQFTYKSYISNQITIKVVESDETLASLFSQTTFNFGDWYPEPISGNQIPPRTIQHLVTLNSINQNVYQAGIQWDDLSVTFEHDNYEIYCDKQIDGIYYSGYVTMTNTSNAPTLAEVFPSEYLDLGDQSIEIASDLSNVNDVIADFQTAYSLNNAGNNFYTDFRMIDHLINSLEISNVDVPNGTITIQAKSSQPSPGYAPGSEVTFTNLEITQL